MHGTKNNPYKEDLIRKFKIHQTHPNKSDEFTKDPSNYQILLDSDNRIDGPSSSPSAKNQTKDIMGMSFIWNLIYIFQLWFTHSDG